MQLNTFDVSISSESSLATALYSVISWQAFGIFTARIFLAWIDANAVQPVAQLVRWTVLVVLANGTWRSHYKRNRDDGQPIGRVLNFESKVTWLA